MKQITFRQLQTNTKWLKDLPVEVTRYGKVVAVIHTPSDGIGHVTLMRGTHRQVDVQKIADAAKKSGKDVFVEGEVSQNETTPHHPSCKCGICKP